MTGRRYLLISTLLICLVTSCTPKPRPPASPAAPSILPNVLVMAEGQVTIKRSDATGFVPTGVGAQVKPGDLLRVDGGEAAIFCGNETEWDNGPHRLAADKPQGVPCLAGRSPRAAPNLGRLRGETTSNVDTIPYVLSPRSGFVRNDRPTLRWHTLASTDVYTTTLISDDGRERPPQRGSGGEMPYPETWPKLASGGSYRLVVQTGERSSKEEEGEEANSPGFSLLNQAKAAQLQEQEAKLRARPFNEQALTLVLAELYLNDEYKLRSEAAALLSGAAVEDLPAAQVLLGEVYLEMGLADEAQAAFEHALALAQQSGLPEFEAGAELGLGSVACLRWDESQAEAHWQTAQDNYATLGLATRAQEAAAMLNTAHADCIR